MEAAITTYSVPLLLIGLLGFFAIVSAWLRRQVPQDSESLADRIEQMLPLTQCAQCGHPGCRPYAEAVAAGGAVDLCPPGGAALVVGLQNLMGANAPLSQDLAQTNPPPLLAVIDESACIGCTLCVDPCPVDAIVGAQGFMHTVIEADCTGCELCIAPCPVDCISLVPKTIAPPTAPVGLLGRGCINCGQCIEACPIKLQPDQLLKLSDANDWDQADSLRLQDCIECGLCDRVCPSEINLSARFTQAKRIAGELSAVEAEKQRIKERYQRHQERLIAVQNEAEDRRARRLATRLAQRSVQGSAQQATQDPSADR